MAGTPKAAVVVLYNQPNDAGAFERYYDATHVPLVGKHSTALGIRRVELTRLASLDGSAPPFYEVFKRYEGDFYKIDPLLFSPAEVWLTSTTSGRTFHAGTLNPDVLRRSLLES